MNSKKKIYFIQTHPTSWNSVKPIFNLLNNNNKFYVKVLVVPTKEIMKNEQDLKNYYSQYKTLIKNDSLIFSYDYLNDNWFDISVSPADFIFFNRPYDSELVHNNYKSKN